MNSVKLVKIYKQLHISALLSIVFVAASWAILRSDFFIFHDFTQGARIAEMVRAVQDGHFPPIWSQNLGFGYGMPLFEFYAPLPYYVSGLFYLLGLNLITSVKLLFLIPTVVTLVGGFLLGKKLYGSLGGILVSASLVLAPYRAVNLFVRGALSEIWGLSMLPLILLGGIKVIKSEKRGWLLLVLSLVGLLLSHNLTALMFLPFSVLFLGAYLLYYARSEQWKLSTLLCKVLHFASYYFLSFIISSFYLIPAYLEKNYTRLESTILADYFDYNNHFLFIRQFFQENWAYGGSTYGPQDDISFYLGFGQLVALLILGYLTLKLLYHLYKKNKPFTKALQMLGTRFLVIFSVSATLLVFALLLTTQKTIFIWDTVEILKFLQFPWRFLNIAVLFLSLTIGGIAVLAQNKVVRYGFTIVVLALLTFNYTYFQPEEFISIAESQNYFYADEEILRTEMSTTLPDYIPIGVTEKVPSLVPSTTDYFYCQLQENCDFEFETLTDRVANKKFSVSTEQSTVAVLTIADYPGWKVFVNDNLVEHKTSKNGLISVEIPEGNHNLSVQLESSEVRKYANILSLLGVSALTLLILLKKMKQPKPYGKN